MTSRAEAVNDLVPTTIRWCVDAWMEPAQVMMMIVMMDDDSCDG